MMTQLLRMWLTRTLKPYKFTNKEATLRFENADNLGLYVHIPFCRSICSFCPYCKEIYDKEKAEKYVSALCGEIELKCKDMKAKKTVTTLYFGGGSPALAIAWLPRIFAQINKYFTVSDGIGLELHPSDVTEENLINLKEIGVTKLSIGIQSFDENVLHALGRQPMDREKLKNCLEKTKFDVVSFDFIFGVYNQTIDTVKKDLDTAFEIGANCVATYPFIDFSHLNSRKKRLKGKREKALIDFINDYCAKNNYHRNSIWTFSKQATQKYSSMTRENFLGFGCSATSLAGDNFLINTFSVDEYIKRIEDNRLPTGLVADFAARQGMVYYLFWQAYSTKISLGQFERKYGKKIIKFFGFELFAAKLLGLVKKDDERLILTNKGAYWFYRLEQHFTLNYIDKMWNIMGKVAFPDEIIIK